VRDRKRLEKIFGFEYTIEMYTPKAKRQYGYYIYPLLEYDQFVGRIEVRHDSESNLLHVDNLWPEQGVSFGKGRMKKLESELVDYPVDKWRQVQAVNVDGTFHCCQAVIPGMVSRDYGRIVNIASIAGKEGNPNASAYSTSKAAVIAMTKSLGKELAEHNISVNCVTPAAAKTRIFDQMSEEFINYMLSKIPRGRFVTVEEIANMIAWAASEENSFTTGAVFDLSGGRATY